jgi:hypothetical protein
MTACRPRGRDGSAEARPPPRQCGRRLVDLANHPSDHAWTEKRIGVRYARHPRINEPLVGAVLGEQALAGAAPGPGCRRAAPSQQPALAHGLAHVAQDLIRAGVGPSEGVRQSEIGDRLATRRCPSHGCSRIGGPRQLLPAGARSPRAWIATGGPLLHCPGFGGAALPALVLAPAFRGPSLSATAPRRRVAYRRAM